MLKSRTIKTFYRASQKIPEETLLSGTVKNYWNVVLKIFERKIN